VIKATISYCFVGGCCGFAVVYVVSMNYWPGDASDSFIFCRGSSGFINFIFWSSAEVRKALWFYFFLLK